MNNFNNQEMPTGEFPREMFYHLIVLDSNGDHTVVGFASRNHPELCERDEAKKIWDEMDGHIPPDPSNPCQIGFLPIRLWWFEEGSDRGYYYPGELL